MKLASVASSLALLLAVPALARAADEIRIERMAPADTVLVAGIADFKELEASVRRTPLWGLFERQPVKDLLKELLEGDGEGESMEDALEEMGLTWEKIARPEGAAGVAVFLQMDEDLGQKKPALLAFADYGAQAEKAQEMFDAVIEKAEKAHGAKVEERKIRGRDVRTVKLPAPPPEAVDVDDEDDWETDGMDPFEGLADAFDEMDEMHLARDGQRFVLSSSLVALEDALEVIDGEKLAAPLADSEDFRGAMKQLGDDRQNYVALFTAPAKPLVAPMFAGPGAMAADLMNHLFGDVRAFALGMAFDGRTAMLEQRVAVLAPGEKKGLLALLTESKPKGDVPAFVGPDAVSFMRVNVKFGEVMAMVRDIVKTLPPGIGDQATMQLEQIGPILDDAFANLGPELCVFATQTEPLTAESQHTVVSIRAPKPEAVRPLIDLFTPALGLRPQDFVGQTVYADELSPVALGIGGGWLSVGELDGVERVLRATGQADLPSLTEEREFRRAMHVIPDGGLVAWGWQDIVQSWAYDRVTMKQTFAELAEFAAEDGLGADFFEKMPMSRIMDTITPEILAEHVGPQAWWLRSTDDGFVLDSIVLAPATPVAPAPKVETVPPAGVK